MEKIREGTIDGSFRALWKLFKEHGFPDETELRQQIKTGVSDENWKKAAARKVSFFLSRHRLLAICLFLNVIFCILDSSIHVPSRSTNLDTCKGDSLDGQARIFFLREATTMDESTSMSALAVPSEMTSASSLSLTLFTSC